MKARKSWSWLVAVMLLVSLLSACSGESGSNAGTDATPNNAGSKGANDKGEEPAAEEPGLKLIDGVKYDPPVQITTVRQVGPEVKFKNGESLDDNVFTRWLKDRMGIGIKTLWTTPTTNDAYKTKIMLTLSANEPLPDYMVVPAEFVSELIDSGKFMAVSDLFEKHASDEWKAAMAETKDVWLPYQRDGEAYAIPMIESSLLHDDVMWIRQDWLDHLGLKAPTTIDELETVMEAFVHDDPDGNGQDDTIAIAAALKQIQYKRISWLGLNPVYGAFGSYAHIWHKDANGEIVYGSTTPETKEALGRIRDWVAKGYLHQEVGLHDEVKTIELFTSGKAGIAFAPTWSHAWPFNQTETNVEGANVQPYPLPSGPDGKIGQIGNGLNHWLVLLINKDMKHPEVLFHYQNYMYEHYEDPPKGGEFEFGFARGYDYDFVNGKLVTTEEEIPGGRGSHPFLIMAPVVPSKQIATQAALADGLQPSTPYEEKANAVSMQTKLASKYVMQQKGHTVNNLYTGPVTPTMKDKQQNLDKLEAEYFSKIMYGQLPLDAFDEWVEEWKKAGGDKIKQEIEAWYEMVGGE